MSKANIAKRRDIASEIALSVKGRKSGRDIPRLIWFVHEGNTLYLLPVQVSDTNWYKNFQAEPTLKITIDDDEETTVRGTPITDRNEASNIVKKFRAKYGEADVNRYYPKTDVAVKVPP